MTTETDIRKALDHLHAGGFKPALKLARIGMKRHKTHPFFANIAGVATGALGSPREAVGYFKQALVLDPGFVDARRNLAQALIQLQKPEAALSQLERVLAQAPDDADAWYLKAQALLATGAAQEAEAAAGEALRLKPGRAAALNLRALARNAQGREAEALEDFEAALASEPDNVQTLLNISLPLARALRGDEAATAIRRATELAGDRADVWLRYGAHLIETGAPEEAKAALQRVLALDPGHADAIEQLAELNDAAENRDTLRLAKQALRKVRKGSEAEASLHFALARIAMKEGEDAEAVAQLGQANAGMARLLPHDAKADAAQMEAVMARFAEPEAASPEAAPGRARPIYVIGLPRSGTTLAEAVLAGNPKVAALGERAVPGVLLGPYVVEGRDFGPAERAAFVAEDVARLPRLVEGRAAYVDKMPENYRLIGFLAAAYPEARFIELRRDPRDVALSLWQARFSGTALSYAYDLEAMAQRFNLYARMMAHWRRVVPGRILQVRYEDMVGDIAATSRAMAAHCGLDWVAGMAEPHAAAGQVLTASATQLRQPVHGRSVGKWRRFETMLAPFVAGLDPALWPEIAE